MAAPLTQFQTAFGQHFDRVSQSVTKIELTATDADGQPVTLAWHDPATKSLRRRGE